ncbi:unnamed protein product [Parnassius apollo]|uniref:(apollo) hypothetical protein n=1 Tax=Parnassius apollo TaxID=110799 RepID=A0A8S3Y815_PARAO|nr:unnamed protein product [Parnassius apollo]
MSRNSYLARVLTYVAQVLSEGSQAARPERGGSAARSKATSCAAAYLVSRTCTYVRGSSVERGQPGIEAGARRQRGAQQGLLVRSSVSRISHVYLRTWLKC